MKVTANRPKAVRASIVRACPSRVGEANVAYNGSRIRATSPGRASSSSNRPPWSRATASFALFQALGGYGYAWLFSHTGENYALIFGCGAVAMAVAFIADFLVRQRSATA